MASSDSNLITIGGKDSYGKDSLLGSIENILKKIKNAESEIMVPTLLQDNCADLDVQQILICSQLLKGALIGQQNVKINELQENICSNGSIEDNSNITDSIIDQINGLKGSLNAAASLLQEITKLYHQYIEKINSEAN